MLTHVWKSWNEIPRVRLNATYFPFSKHPSIIVTLWQCHNDDTFLLFDRRFDIEVDMKSLWQFLSLSSPQCDQCDNLVGRTETINHLLCIWHFSLDSEFSHLRCQCIFMIVGVCIPLFYCLWVAINAFLKQRWENNYFIVIEFLIKISWLKFL